jgi:hypothetical protein
MGNRSSCCGGCDKREFGEENDKDVMKNMYSEDVELHAKDLEARMAHVNWAKEPL